MEGEGDGGREWKRRFEREVEIEKGKESEIGRER